MSEGIEYLNSTEIKKLLNAADNPRDLAILTLFLNTGIYMSELTDLKLDSIDWKNNILKVPGKRRRDIPLNDELIDALARWTKDRRDGKTKALFVTSQGEVRELSERVIDIYIRRYAEKAGIKKRVNSQILRNTFGVRLFREDITREQAAALLGITEPKCINRYIEASKLPPEEIPLPPVKTDFLDTRPWIMKTFSKLFPVKPKTAKVITGLSTLDPEKAILGRDNVIRDIKSMRNKVPGILIKGPIGIGKSHLLKHLHKLFIPDSIYFSSASPLKNMLLQIADRTLQGQRKVVNIRSTNKEILDILIKSKRSKPLLIIDNLNNLKSAEIEQFLLLMDNFEMICAADDMRPRLKQVWWKFKQIELKPLDDDSSRELIEYLTQNLSVSDPEMLETRILSLSNGLPLAIVEMVRQVSHQHVIDKESIRDIYHEAGVYYRDWTFAIIVLWGLAVIFRFVALGTHSFEGYILAGFGTAFFMVIRFFAFRMRR